MPNVSKFWAKRKRGTICRPNGNINNLWSNSGFSAIDDPIFFPAGVGDAQVAFAGQGDNNLNQQWTLQPPGKNATQIKIRVLCARLGGINPPLGLTVNGVTQTTTLVIPQSAPFVYGWQTVTFVGSWLASDFVAGFSVGIQTGVLNSLNGLGVEALYAEVF